MFGAEVRIIKIAMENPPCIYDFLIETFVGNFLFGGGPACIIPPCINLRIKPPFKLPATISGFPKPTSPPVFFVRCDLRSGDLSCGGVTYKSIAL